MKLVAKWLGTGATNTPAFKDAVATLENFYDVEEGGPNTAAFIYTWKNHRRAGTVKYSM